MTVVMTCNHRIRVLSAVVDSYGTSAHIRPFSDTMNGLRCAEVPLRIYSLTHAAGS